MESTSDDVTAETERLAGLEARFKKESKALSVNFGELKSGGYIKQRQKDLFTIRLRCPGGKMTAERMLKIAEVANKYGAGRVHLSVRQSIEILDVNIADFDAVAEELREVDQLVASCGPRVRVPTACGGCSYNPNGLMDTQAHAEMVDDKYFGTPTHHKFKITFAGCPIDCPHSRQADLGFTGQVEPELIPDLCTACEICVKRCEDDALTMVDGLPVRDWEKCIRCGDCVKACPFDAMVQGRKGYAVHVGGKGGKHMRLSDHIADMITEDKIEPFIQRTLDWYTENGQRRERVGRTIDRVGLDKYKEEVLDGI